MTKKTETKTEALLDEHGEHYQRHGSAVLRMGSNVSVATCRLPQSEDCTVHLIADGPGMGMSMHMGEAGARQLHALLGQAIETAQAVAAALAETAQAAAVAAELAERSAQATGGAA